MCVFEAAENVEPAVMQPNSNEILNARTQTHFR